jgi:aspartyl-tRNA synthetase
VLHGESHGRGRRFAARKKSWRGKAERKSPPPSEAKPGDLIVAVSAKEQIPGTDAAARRRRAIALAARRQMKFIPHDRWEFLWITGFALFEWNDTEKRWVSAQHPFTGIVDEDIPKARRPFRRSAPVDALEGLRSGAERRRARLGQHPNPPAGIAGPRVQDAGPQRGAAPQRFGFFLDALTYGTPPHGGIAFGLDRVTAACRGEIDPRSDRLPEDGEARRTLMADSPSAVDEK